MRSGVLFAVLGASFTLATAAAAQEAPKPPPPAQPATAGGAPVPPPPPSGQPPLPPPPPSGDHPPMPNDQWHHPGPDGQGPGQMPNDQWHHPGPEGWHHPPMGPMGPMGNHAVEPVMHDAHNRVQISVDSGDKPVVLERRVKKEEMDGRLVFVIPRSENTETWEQVCVSPCTLNVDRASTYRISKENFVTQSGTFLLPSGPDQVKLDVKPGNWWWHNVGTKLIGTGTVAGITGAALISLAHTWDSKHSEKHVRAAGIITASVGALALAVGIPLAILTKTKITENGVKVGKADPHKPPPAKLTLDGLVF